MNIQMLNGCLPALMTPSQSDHSADHDAVMRKGRTQELDQAMAVLPSFDEGMDLELFCKYLLTCLRAQEYALNINPTDQLSPSGSHDRSPCGRGTSALLACLAADGQLKAGQPWVQNSIIGSTYRLSYATGENGGIIPTIRGRDWVTAEARLHFAPDDPYVAGIGAA